MLAIISDTHENIPAISEAVTMLKGLSPGLVIHCGDIISPPTLERFRGLPMRFVFGNNDGERSGLKLKCAELGFGEIADELTLDFEGKRFFVIHGTRAVDVSRAAASGKYDYVCHGHTHVVRDERAGRTRIINPGALFAAKNYTFATLDVRLDKLEILTVRDDAEW